MGHWGVSELLYQLPLDRLMFLFLQVRYSWAKCQNSVISEKGTHGAGWVLDKSGHKVEQPRSSSSFLKPMP